MPKSNKERIIVIIIEIIPDVIAACVKGILLDVDINEQQFP